MPQPDDAAAALEQLRISYAQWFAMAPAIVVDDLQRFCRANESTFHPNPHGAARLDGRREVWLHMQELAQLDPVTLFRLYMSRRLANAHAAS